MGFQYLDGATNMIQAFTSCEKLETIWATSFDYTTITTATFPFNGCRELVGQTGYVAPDSAGKATSPSGPTAC